MSTTIYDIGDTVRMTALVTNSTGGAVSASLQLVIDRPTSTSLVIAAGSLTNPVTGTYRYDYVVREAGRWTFEFRSTGNVVATQGDAFAVRPRRAST